MLNNVSETTMHRVRWILTIGWLGLIASLLYDPITPWLTRADHLFSPFHITPERALNPQQCIKIRQTCLPEQPYAMGALIWWAMIVPAGILILQVLGHEFWRRICPLSFLSQIPRALGMQRKHQIKDPVTGERRWDLVKISESSWLGRNHLYVQFGLFVLGLIMRILFINSDRFALATFLLFTIACAILVGYLYAGKSWCQYFCPMAPVQMVYTGPRALLGSQAHLAPQPTVTQSMCRTVDAKTGQAQSACVSCKMPCIDIDAEKNYWAELQKPGRRLVQYGYLGMVIAFYLYYFLYAGNWDYYFTGAWTHEPEQVARITDVGFYILGRAIPIPKYAAVTITFVIFVALCWGLGRGIEKLYRWHTARQGKLASVQQTQHVVFTVFTTTSFWVFFSYGARPSLNRLPPMLLLGFNALVVLVGAIWLFRTLGRQHEQYERERLAVSLRKQLQKQKLDRALPNGRSLDDLTPDEIYTLVHVLPEFSQQLRLETYIGVILDLLEQQVIDLDRSFEFCQKLRQELQLDDSQHFAMMEAIAATHPEVLASARKPNQPMHNAITIAKTIGKRRKRPKLYAKPSTKHNTKHSVKSNHSATPRN
jgi:ABC-type nickel/cobalt efflux system permease component RcnA